VNDQERERFEAELRQFKPAQPPPDFMGRLVDSRPAGRIQQTVKLSLASLVEGWIPRLRWLAPAAAVVLVAGVLTWRWNTRIHEPSNPHPGSSNGPAITADAVQIDHELVSTFDAVARLPGGEPVRFRCREWMDEVVLRDTARGVVIEQRTPRMEVVPVRFETY
jgi:hypothetical protein